MKWETDENGLPVDYIGDSESTPVTEAMRELWRNAESIPLTEAVRELWKKYIEDIAPQNADMSWDYLGVYIYLDSGRIILFPVNRAYRHRTEEASCQLTCNDVLASYQETANSNMPDDEFEVWAKAAESRVADLVSQAAKHADLPKRLSRPEVRVCYYAYSGEEGPIREDILIN